MAKFHCFIPAAAISFAMVPFAYSQIATCTLASPTPPHVPSAGVSEIIENVVMTCASTEASQSILIDLQVTLNTNLTSRITDSATGADEALLLIDDPKPGMPNVSNTFNYFGQVLGTPGVLAGAAGSGNVYQGAQLMSGGTPVENAVVFNGIPYVTGGTRTFTFTNLRANVSLIGIGPVEAFVSLVTDVSVEIANPEITVAEGANALNFSYRQLAGAPGIVLTFAEEFPRAFRKRDENFGAPLTLIRQDEPTTSYCTQSGFIPTFQPLASGAWGLASTGTRLVANISGIPAGVAALNIPDQVTSSSGDLVAQAVLPPYGTYFAAGTLTSGTGTTAIPVTAGTAQALYEVLAAAPYTGVTGCTVLDTFNIAAIPSPFASMTTATATGALAPQNPIPTASTSLVEPRFVP
jgi:hypothetical protein